MLSQVFEGKRPSRLGFKTTELIRRQEYAVAETTDQILNETREQTGLVATFRLENTPWRLAVDQCEQGDLVPLGAQLVGHFECDDPSE